MSRKVTFAVVGYGYIGKRHAEIISKHPDCKLVAICDTEKKISEEGGQKHGVSFYKNLSDLLSEVECDIISICSPNGTHTSLAKEALTAGNHVLIEKPMGLSSKECVEVNELAKKKGKEVFCVMQNRYSPPSSWLKKVLTENILGDIYLVQINCFWNRDDRYYSQHAWRGTMEMDGGPLFTQFSHFMDLIYWLFGSVSQVRSKFKNFNHQENTDFEDSGTISFDFDKGGIGVVNYSTSTWDKNFESSITILGENGTIRVGGQYMEKVEYCHVKNYSAPNLPPSNPPNDYGPYKGSAANHHYIFENVVNTLLKKEVATTNGEDGAAVVKMIEDFYSTRQKKRGNSPS